MKRPVHVVAAIVYYGIILVIGLMFLAAVAAVVYVTWLKPLSAIFAVGLVTCGVGLFYCANLLYDWADRKLH